MTTREPAEKSEHPGGGRLLVGLAWALLLLGLWLWGRDVTGLHGTSGPTTGDVAAVGRPQAVELPPAHRPLAPAAPKRLMVPAIGVGAPVVGRGLDEDGAVEPPPFDRPGLVGWYRGGAEPGSAGAAILVGHVDTRTRSAVFYNLSGLRPGRQIRVTRSDGTVAAFTVDDVQVFSRDRFDARKAYGPHEPGRAELRLITCGGSFDRAKGAYSANVVVSAYLTGVER